MYWLSDDEVQRAAQVVAGRSGSAQATYVARLVELYFVQPSRVRGDAVALDELCPHVAASVGRVCHAYDFVDTRQYDTRTPRALERPVLLPAVLAVLTQRVVWAHAGVLLSSARLDAWCGDALGKPTHSRVARVWTLALHYMDVRARQRHVRERTSGDDTVTLDLLLRAEPATMTARCAHTLTRLLASDGTAWALARRVRAAIDDCVCALLRLYAPPHHSHDTKDDMRARIVALCGAADVLALVQRVWAASATHEVVLASTSQELAVACLLVCVQRACEACLAPHTVAVTRERLVASADALHRLHSYLIVTLLATAPSRRKHVRRLHDACASIARGNDGVTVTPRQAAAPPPPPALRARACGYVAKTTVSLQHVVQARVPLRECATTRQGSGACRRASHVRVSSDALRRFVALFGDVARSSNDALTCIAANTARDGGNAQRSVAARAAQRQTCARTSCVCTLSLAPDDVVDSVARTYVVDDADERRARTRIVASLCMA